MQSTTKNRNFGVNEEKKNDVKLKCASAEFFFEVISEIDNK